MALPLFTIITGKKREFTALITEHGQDSSSGPFPVFGLVLGKNKLKFVVFGGLDNFLVNG
jgi:hypothetical protein